MALLADGPELLLSPEPVFPIPTREAAFLFPVYKRQPGDGFIIDCCEFLR